MVNIVTRFFKCVFQEGLDGNGYMIVHQDMDNPNLVPDAIITDEKGNIIDYHNQKFTYTTDPDGDVDVLPDWAGTYTAQPKSVKELTRETVVARLKDGTITNADLTTWQAEAVAPVI